MSRSLKKYKEKRNFAITDEPKGEVKRKKSSELKYVVQYHIARKTHYDLRLEYDGVLLSWAVPKGPSFNPKDKRLAIRVEDHPIDYADFEGLIAKGEYGGGTVMVWDTGYWTPHNDVREGLETGSLKFEINGMRMKGNFTLIKLRSEENKDNWLLIKENDEFKKRVSGINSYKTSVKTGRTIAEINKNEDLTKKENPFAAAEVQLAKLVTNPPKGDDYLFEIKYDGYRILSYLEKGKAVLKTRNDKDFTKRFRKIAAALEKISNKRAMVLDGEIVAVDLDGRPDFQALQDSHTKKSDRQIVYMVFDILALDGKDLRGLPLTERKAKLSNILKDAPANIMYLEHIVGNGEDVLAAAKNMGLEGIIGKRADSTYTGGTNNTWIKVKCYKRQEFVIGGYTNTGKRANGISNVLLGVYDKNKLMFVGHSGTGFNLFNSKDLLKKFAKLKSKKSPFANDNIIKEDNVIYLKPELVCEIQFAEMTKDNILRQASFKGLREDKNPKDVILESAIVLDKGESK